MFKKLSSLSLREFVSPEAAICLLRIGAAALIMTHGIPKLMRILEGDFSFRDPIGIGSSASLVLVTFAEAFCSLLVLLGLWTRAALVPLIITMFVVAFIVHAGDPVSGRRLPLFYFITFLYLFFTGPGKYSLDYIFTKK